MNDFHSAVGLPPPELATSSSSPGHSGGPSLDRNSAARLRPCSFLLDVERGDVGTSGLDAETSDMTSDSGPGRESRWRASGEVSLLLPLSLGIDFFGVGVVRCEFTGVPPDLLSHPVL